MEIGSFGAQLEWRCRFVQRTVEMEMPVLQRTVGMEMPVLQRTVGMEMSIRTARCRNGDTVAVCWEPTVVACIIARKLESILLSKYFGGTSRHLFSTSASATSAW